MDELSRLRRDWDDMADLNPLWHLAPSDRVANRTWDPAAFFESGRAHVQRDLERLRGLGVPMATGSMLDFGCGVGRQTQAFADVFDVCDGVDLSPGMIALADRFNRHGPRCRYTANARDDLQLFSDGCFDLVYSNNALMHVSPDTMRRYIAEFVRVMKPGGVLMFHVPVERIAGDEGSVRLRQLPRLHPRRVWNKLVGTTIGHGGDRYTRLRRLGLPGALIHRVFRLDPPVAIHFLPEADVRAALQSLGIAVVQATTYTYKDRRDAVFIGTRLPQR